MSYRSSFVTNYMYCKNCLAETLSRFTEAQKEIDVDIAVIKESVIAGRIKGLYSGSELNSILYISGRVNVCEECKGVNRIILDCESTGAIHVIQLGGYTIN